MRGKAAILPDDQNVVLDCPTHGNAGILTNGTGIGNLREFPILRSAVPPKDRCELLPAYRIIHSEGVVSIALHGSVGAGPRDSVGVPCPGLGICKIRGRTDIGFALRPVKHHCQHSACQIAVRGKGIRCGSAHDAVFPAPSHGFGIPRIGGNIRKAAD